MGEAASIAHARGALLVVIFTEAVSLGLLEPPRDADIVAAQAARVVSRRAPTPGELAALDFAWRVCKHVKSNAIVVATGTEVLGVGAGQMSRVDSVRLAIHKAGVRAFPNLVPDNESAPGAAISREAAVFLGEIQAVLRRTTVFAYPARVRFHFVLGGALRHPAILVLWGTAVKTMSTFSAIRSKATSRRLSRRVATRASSSAQAAGFVHSGPMGSARPAATRAYRS